MSDQRRRLMLQGAVNVRDIGGYPTQGGQLTRAGVFLRADNLDRLTDADQQMLLDYGVRRIIDLRSLPELQNFPDVFAQSPHVIYQHLPLLEDKPQMAFVEAMPSHYEVYVHLLDQCQPQIRAVLETLATADAACTLYHCTGGKDRTGVISALLLGLAGVDAVTIAQDYALTGDYLAPRVAQWRQRAVDAGEDMERFDRLMLTNPDVMRRTLVYLHEHYGSIPDYVKAIGLTDSAIDQLRNRFVGGDEEQLFETT